MVQRLKRWESPRRQGRNDKGKGGSARKRQLKKQLQMLRKKLKEGQEADHQNQKGGGDISSLPLFGDYRRRQRADGSRAEGLILIDGR